MNYTETVESLGYTVDWVEKRSSSAKWFMSRHIGKSDIQGQGFFAIARIGELVGKAVWGKERTELGRYINHSSSPNARLEVNGDDVDVIAIREIDGEVTVDYVQVDEALNEV